MSVCFRRYIGCVCNLDGKWHGKRCPYCDGWGAILEELPPCPRRIRRRIDQARRYE